MSEARWFVPAGSAAGDWAAGIAWLWRLGPRSGEPSPGAVGLGTAADAAALTELALGGELAGAVILEGEGTGRVVRDANVLRVGLGVDDWGSLHGAGAYGGVADFLAAVLDGPLTMLPPIGCLRIDDSPGTAQRQVEGTAKGDGFQSKRFRAVEREYRRRGAVLNLAVAAEAFDDDRNRVPLDQVWPDAIRAMRAGVQSGAFEPVCHGLLHLDPAELENGRVEFREFANLPEAEAGERIDAALAWHRRCLGDPRSFVAPAWAYGEHGRAAAHARGLATWSRPAPGPLVNGDDVRETLFGHLPGLRGVDYSPLVSLTKAGVPVTVTLHGGLIDGRSTRPRSLRDLVALARLALRRDLERLAGVEGIRWLGATEFVRVLRAHDATEVIDGEVKRGGSS
jgi:hypothetical protein